MAMRGRFPGAIRCGFAVMLALWLGLAVPILTPGTGHGARVAAQGADASVRLVHGLAAGGPLDVYIDGSLALIGIVFGEVSAALILPGGAHEFAVVPTGGAVDAPLTAGTIELREGTNYFTALLGTVDAVSVGLFGIDESPLDPGRARFRIISGVSDTDAIVPAFAGGDALSQPLGFGDASQYATLDAGTYDLDMLDSVSGASLLALPETVFAEGTTTDILLVGQISDGSMEALIESVPVEIDRPTGLLATIVPGTCTEADEPVVDLGIVQPGQGEAVGVQNVASVAQGFGLAPLSFSALTSAPHAVVVREDDAEGAQVACGPIGGQLTDTGALVVALEPAADGAADGVAVLAPALENPETTGVSIFLTGAS